MIFADSTHYLIKGKELTKKLVSGIMLTLLLTSMLTLAFNIQPVKSDYAWNGIIYVRADGSIQPPTAPISSVDNVTYTLTDNIVGNVPEGISAIVIQRDNTIVDGAGYTLQGANAYGSTGIELTGRSNVTIKNMKITAFYYGIFFSSSSNNSVSGNNITNDDGGIWLGSSSNNSIIGNNITANNGYGIWLIFSSFNSSISGNNITANNWDGIGLYASNYSSVSGNTVANNGYGINFYMSSNNRIYHNDFINNAGQVYSSGSTNVWDDGYPSGGNYWSDYGGVDEKKGINQDEPGSDGLGDTPYLIGTDQDHYPLMYQWRGRKLCDVNGDGSVDMADISLMIDWFMTSPPNWNPNCDVNGDLTVDMADISIAIDNFMQS